jgi:hypothetical protein
LHSVGGSANATGERNAHGFDVPGLACRPVDWGTVPAWVGAVGTVAAFAVTVALLLREIRLRREQMSDEEKLQARLVWVDERCLAVHEIADCQMVEARPVVHNDSDETIRDALVRVYETAARAAQRTSRDPILVIPRRVTLVSDSRCQGANPAHEHSASAERKRCT